MTYKELKEITGYSDREMKKSLKELQKAGLIVWIGDWIMPLEDYVDMINRWAREDFENGIEPEDDES